MPHSPAQCDLSKARGFVVWTGGETAGVTSRATTARDRFAIAIAETQAPLPSFLKEPTEEPSHAEERHTCPTGPAVAGSA